MFYNSRVYIFVFPFLRPKLVIIDLLEDGINDTTQLTKMSPVGIVTNLAICPKTAPFLKYVNCVIFIFYSLKIRIKIT